jgi:hypothetical protein
MVAVQNLKGEIIQLIMKNWREKGHMIRSNEKDNFKQAGR